MLTRLVGALVLLKAVDVALRGPGNLGAAAWLLALATLTAAGALLAVGRTSRPVWTAVLVSGLALAADAPVDLRRQHLVLLLGVALAAAVARDERERLLLWRSQLSVLYGVAALAKLNESFLGGGVLAVALRDGPGPTVTDPRLLVPAAAAVVVTEVALAAAPWHPRTRTPGLVVAAVLHGGGLVLLPADPIVALRLLVFGGLAVLLHAASAAEPSPGPAERRTDISTRPSYASSIHARRRRRPPSPNPTAA